MNPFYERILQTMLSQVLGVEVNLADVARVRIRRLLLTAEYGLTTQPPQPLPNKAPAPAPSSRPAPPKPTNPKKHPVDKRNPSNRGVAHRRTRHSPVDRGRRGSGSSLVAKAA